jgi:hypothetical protein
MDRINRIDRIILWYAVARVIEESSPGFDEQRSLALILNILFIPSNDLSQPRTGQQGGSQIPNPRPHPSPFRVDGTA